MNRFAMVALLLGSAAGLNPASALQPQSAVPVLATPPRAPRWVQLFDIVHAREIAGGYELDLRAVPILFQAPPLIRRFRSTLALPALPRSLRLMLILDITDRRRPRIIEWAFVRQEVCATDAWIERNNLAETFEDPAARHGDGQTCSPV